MDIYKETSPSGDLKHGHTVVGVTAVPLTNISLNCLRGILVRAPGANDPGPNTHPVWVGRAAVTADSSEGRGGIPILPGAAIILPVDDPSKVFVISTAAGQDIGWLCV